MKLKPPRALAILVRSMWITSTAADSAPCISPSQTRETNDDVMSEKPTAFHIMLRVPGLRKTMIVSVSGAVSIGARSRAHGGGITRSAATLSLTKLASERTCDSKTPPTASVLRYASSCFRLSLVRASTGCRRSSLLAFAGLVSRLPMLTEASHALLLAAADLRRVCAARARGSVELVVVLGIWARRRTAAASCAGARCSATRGRG